MNNNIQFLNRVKMQLLLFSKFPFCIFFVITQLQKYQMKHFVFEKKTFLTQNCRNGISLSCLFNSDDCLAEKNCPSTPIKLMSFKQSFLTHFLHVAAYNLSEKNQLFMAKS